MFWFCLLLCSAYVAADLLTATPDVAGFGGNMVEGFLKDLFRKEMSTVDQGNMTDCMTRLLCENICARTVSGEIKEPLLTSKGIMGPEDPSMPKNLDYFFAGGDRGFELGKKRQCDKCATYYSDCKQDHYQYAKQKTDDFDIDFSLDLDDANVP